MPASKQKLLRTALAASQTHARSLRQWRDLLTTPCLGLSAWLVWPWRRSYASCPGRQLAVPAVRKQLAGGIWAPPSAAVEPCLAIDAFFEAIGIELLVGYGSLKPAQC